MKKKDSMKTSTFIEENVQKTLFETINFILDFNNPSILQVILNTFKLLVTKNCSFLREFYKFEVEEKFALQDLHETYIGLESNERAENKKRSTVRLGV